MCQEVTVKRVVVLGAGLSGLSAAWVLRRQGYHVAILDKADACGGLAVTKSRGAYRYDLGPHNIHTSHDHILAFLERHLGDSLMEHSPTSQILNRGKLIDYPLRGGKVLTALPRWKRPFAVASFLAARLRMGLRLHALERSFEQWIVNRFGRVLFGEYFGPYAMKVWGLPGRELDKHIAEKRVPAPSLRDVIRGALGRAPGPIDHPEYRSRNLYLRSGVGEIAEFFESALRADDAEMRLCVTLTAVRLEGARVASVEFQDGSGAACSLECDYLLSTIPVPDFIRLIDAVPPDVAGAAARLDYRSTILVFLQTRKLTLCRSPMLYFSDGRIPISRISDVGAFSSAMVPEGQSLFCAEVPCSEGDSAWARPDDEVSRGVIRALEEQRLLSAGDIEDRFVERISHSHPRFRLGFQNPLNTCLQFVSRLENAQSFGRQGSFAYLNSDGVIDLGLKAARSVIDAETSSRTRT